MNVNHNTQPVNGASTLRARCGQILWELLSIGARSSLNGFSTAYKLRLFLILLFYCWVWINTIVDTHFVTDICWYPKSSELGIDGTTYNIVEQLRRKLNWLSPKTYSSKTVILWDMADAPKIAHRLGFQCYSTWLIGFSECVRDSCAFRIDYRHQSGATCYFRVWP